jgi:hypothetical protein
MKIPGVIGLANRAIDWSFDQHGSIRWICVSLVYFCIHSPLILAPVSWMVLCNDGGFLEAAVFTAKLSTFAAVFTALFIEFIMLVDPVFRRR